MSLSPLPALTADTDGAEQMGWGGWRLGLSALETSLGGAASMHIWCSLCNTSYWIPKQVSPFSHQLF